MIVTVSRRVSGPAMIAKQSAALFYAWVPPSLEQMLVRTGNTTSFDDSNSSNFHLSAAKTSARPWSILAK